MSEQTLFKFECDVPKRAAVGADTKRMNGYIVANSLADAASQAERGSRTNIEIKQISTNLEISKEVHEEKNE